MRKVLVAFALLLSGAVAADASSLDYKARMTAYTIDGEKAGEVVTDCPNVKGLGLCQTSFEVTFEGEPWGLGIHLSELTPGVLTVKVVGDARPADSWNWPSGKETVDKKPGATVEIEARWTDSRISGDSEKQRVPVARFKIEIL